LIRIDYCSSIDGEEPGSHPQRAAFDFEATSMKKKPAYYIFYLIFSPDTWRLAIGVIGALWVGPKIFGPEMNTTTRAVTYVMLTAIGWAAGGVPARWICQGFKQLILGGKMPR
jgi:hypothetical protein